MGGWGWQFPFFPCACNVVALGARYAWRTQAFGDTLGLWGGSTGNVWQEIVEEDVFCTGVVSLS